MSESFMIKSGEKLLIRGNNYIYQGSMSCNIYLINSSGVATTLFSTGDAGTTTVAILKSGLEGLYSLKIVMTSYSNWQNSLTFTDCKVIKE